MRPLMLSPPKATRYFSCRSGQSPSQCQPWVPTSESFKWLWLQQQLGSLKEFCHNYMFLIRRSWFSQTYLEYELNCGLSFIWLIQGLVCICIRSLKEDKYGILQDDLESIFQVLIDLENLLHLADNFQKNCSAKLLPPISRSINSLIYYFHPYFDFIVKDANLRRELQSRKQ